MPKFNVAYTADFLEADGSPKFRDYLSDMLDTSPGIAVSHFADYKAEVTADQIDGSQIVVLQNPQITRNSLVNNENLLAVCCFGAGYDNVDVGACSQADVLLCNTRGAVDRPVAEAIVGWMIALTHHMLVKDRLVRTGRWDDTSGYMGTELRERTLGVIGFGGIGRALVKLLSGFGMNTPLIFDPFVSEEVAHSHSVRRVELHQLLREADFVSVNCPLNENSRGLLGSRELGLMKPTAYLINTARGGIINEDALFNALSERRIAGAAIDCFEGEPILSPHRFGTLENVILAPHSIAWTYELFRDIGRAVCQNIVSLALGQRPRTAINPEVFERHPFSVNGIGFN